MFHSLFFLIHWLALASKEPQMGYARRQARKFLLSLPHMLPKHVVSHVSGMLTISLPDSNTFDRLEQLAKDACTATGISYRFIAKGSLNGNNWLKFSAPEMVAQQSQGGTLSPAEQASYDLAIATFTEAPEANPAQQEASTGDAPASEATPAPAPRPRNRRGNNREAPVAR